MMPKKARQRQPDESVLATFMIPYEKWQDFQKTARAEGTTASATLVAFIEAYLAGNRPSELELAEPKLETQLEAEFDKNLDTLIEKAVERKIASFDAILNNLQKAVTQIDERLEKDARLEKAVGQKIASFDEMLNHCQKVVKQLDESLIKVEKAAHQSNDSKNKAPKFIDVEAVTIDNDIEKNADTDTDTTFDELNGLTQKALCEEFGINPSKLVRNASMRGLSSSDYLHQLTGWVYKNGRYYPPQR